MKICAPATYRPKVDLNILDEIDLKFTEEHELKDLISFCNQYKDKRINIEFYDIDIEKLFKDRIELIFSIKEILKDNLYVKLSFEQLVDRKYFEEQNIKYFSNYCVDSYIKLRYFLHSTKVSDIYVTDDLCYNLKEVFLICKNNGVALRMVLNRIPSTFIYAGELFDSPIYRPQDFDMLNMFISTAEFDCWDGDYYKWNEFEVLYKRWFKQKKWNEDLKYINKDIKFEFINDKVPLGYSFFRSTCNHRCMMREGMPCSKCSRFLQQMDWFKKDPE